MKKAVLCFIIQGVLLLYGCAGQSAFQPLECHIQPPKVKNLKSRVVDSLKPTLQWEPVAVGGDPASYDVVIYEAYVVRIAEVDPFADDDSSEKIERVDRLSKGERIYYQADLSLPECMVNKALKANTGYFWTVRAKIKGKTSPWAEISRHKIVPIPFLGLIDIGHINYFFFKTPRQ